jgi:hypothetical protein
VHVAYEGCSLRTALVPSSRVCGPRLDLHAVVREPAYGDGLASCAGVEDSLFS